MRFRTILVGMLLALFGGAGAAVAAGPPAATCESVATDIQLARLNRAETALRIAELTCQPDLSQLIADRRARAQEIVTSALAHPESAVTLARAALLIDADSAPARALLSLSGVPAPAGMPRVAATPRPKAEPKPNAYCTQADKAVAAGDLARAESLLVLVKAGEQCRTDVETAIAAARAESVTSRARGELNDLLPAAAVLGVALVAGGLLARFVLFPWWLRRTWVRRSLTGVVLLALGALALVLLSGVLAAFAGSGPLDGLVRRLGTVAQRVFSPVSETRSTQLVWWPLALGFLAIWLVRAATPMRITVLTGGKESPDEGTPNSGFAALVAGEVSSISAVRPQGVTAVAGGADISDAGLSATFDAITSPFLKALWGIWKTMTSGAGDDATIRLVGSGLERIAAVEIRTLRRRSGGGVVRARDLVADPDAISETETRDLDRDLAGGVAAILVLHGLSVVPGQRQLLGRRRLYGTTEPIALALCAIAARRMAKDKQTAQTLYARAVTRDPGSDVARYGAALATVPATTKSGDVLATIADKYRRDPLGWRASYNLVVDRVNSAAKRGQPTRSLADEYIPRLEKLAARLSLRFWTGLPRHDRIIVRNLRDLSTSALAGLRLLRADGLAESRTTLRTLGELNNPDLSTNLACSHILDHTANRYPSALGDAVADLEVAGQIPANRKTALDDPVVKLIADTGKYRDLQRRWGEPDAAYERIASIGADAAQRLAPRYPDAISLRLALPDSLTEIAATAQVPEAVVAQWWPGALDWLAAGRSIETINLYQAAGYPDAAAVARDGDTQVLWRLGRIAAWDTRLGMPPAWERELMRPSVAGAAAAPGGA